MKREYFILEFIAGIFVLLAAAALLFLAVKVSKDSFMQGSKYYNLSAEFGNIGDLVERAPITISGVKVGYVDNIELNPQTYNAVVKMKILDKYMDIPVDSRAEIYSSGIIGNNYVNISPGFAEKYLSDGGLISYTREAIIIQQLVNKVTTKFFS